MNINVVTHEIVRKFKIFIFQTLIPNLLVVHNKILTTVLKLNSINFVYSGGTVLRQGKGERVVQLAGVTFQQVKNYELEK